MKPGRFSHRFLVEHQPKMRSPHTGYDQDLLTDPDKLSVLTFNGNNKGASLGSNR